MAKKNFSNLESSTKNIGGGVSSLFPAIAKTQKAEEIEKVKEIVNADDLDETTSFSLTLPIEAHQYIRSLASLKAKEGNYNYNLKAGFLESLEMLKNENPLVKDETPVERRFYRGGEQKKNKEQTFATSVIITKRTRNWIDNYIIQERQKDEFFSKPDFLKNLIDQLKKRYGKLI